MNTVNDLRQALSEEVVRLQPAAGLEARVLQQALYSPEAAERGPRSGRRIATRTLATESVDAPRLMALVAALLTIAMVVSFVLAARALHSRSSVPAHPEPVAQAPSNPLPTQLCRSQCEVASQPALQPKPAAVRQCATACATQYPVFATANIGWITDSVAGPDGPAFLYRTDDGSKSWRAVLSWDGPGAQQIRAGTGGNEALIVTAWGSRGTTLFHTSDGGAHWTAAGLPVGADSNSTVYFINALEGWVTADRNLIHTTDGGAHWTRVASLDSASSYSSFNEQPGIGLIDSSFGWFVPPYNPMGDSAPHLYLNLYLTHDGGATWSGHTLSRPAGLSATMTAFDATIQFFDDQQGVFHVAYSPGAPCSLRGASTLPPCRTDYVYITSDGGAHWSAPLPIPSQKTVFIDATHWFGLTGDLMAASSVIRTVDAGHHWSVLFAPPSQSNVLSNWDLGQAIGFIDPTYGWAISPDGSQLLVTSDGGMTWGARPLPG